jgi:hypothetical protein
LRIETKQNGKAVKLALSSVDEVRAATWALLTGKARRSGPRSAEEQALVCALGRFKALKRVSVDVSGNVARFGRVPLEALEDFGRALSKASLPAVKAVNAVKKGSRRKSSPARAANAEREPCHDERADSSNRRAGALAQRWRRDAPMLAPSARGWLSEQGLARAARGRNDGSTVALGYGCHDWSRGG